MCTKSLHLCLTLCDPMDHSHSELSCPPPGDLPNLGIESTSLMPPALAGRFFTTSATWMPLLEVYTGLPW